MGRGGEGRGQGVPRKHFTQTVTVSSNGIREATGEGGYAILVHRGVQEEDCDPGGSGVTLPSPVSKAEEHYKYECHVPLRPVPE